MSTRSSDSQIALYNVLCVDLPEKNSGLAFVIVGRIIMGDDEANDNRKCMGLLNTF